MAPARARDGPASKTLPERVGQLYYAYGLFCASHPIAFLFFALFFVALCCIPLLNLPLPGNVPQHFATYSSNQSGGETLPSPVWFTGPPICYVQQIIMKTAVSPWNEKLVLTDAFRGPLAEVFTLLESIRNYEVENSSRSLSHVCLHVEAVKSRYTSDRKHILPEYNCLVLSPANLWHQDFQEFQQDSSLLSTIFNYVNLQRSKISLAEISFGLSLKDTGIKRYPLRTRQRTLQYAVTLILQKNDSGYIDGMRKRLKKMYPLHQDSISEEEDGPALHVYYPGDFHWRQVVPLLALYFVFSSYVYFSARKVESIKSKVGLAFCAVLTLVASLLMSTGLCYFFGHMLTMTWREVYPYLAMVVGLENIFVISKAVYHTPNHLDVKIRVAQGLSKEGWSITCNLLTEVTILTFGLFTFVPAIQRFSIFAVVGLLSDFFMQMTFFTPALSALSSPVESGKYRHSLMQSTSTGLPTVSTFGTILRSKSHPRLNGIITQSSERFPTIVVAPVHYAGKVLNKIPRRIRILHFWARTRFVQRSFKVFMVSWIAFIAYNSDCLENYFQIDTTDREWEKATGSASWQFEQNHQQYLATSAPVLDNHNMSSLTHGYAEEDISRLRPNRYEPWDRLSPYHWSTILSLYNISTNGRYISILPSIRLSHVITAENALLLRNPNEGTVQHFHWQTLAAALDPLDFSDGDQRLGTGSFYRKMTELPLLPSSPMELFFLSLLCVVSVGVLAYCMVLLYRCVCSRNYAEWRAGWVADPESSNADTSTEVVLEAIPLVLEGHPQEVECIASDGSIVVSTCLAGQLVAWDAVSGETLACVDRKQFFACKNGEREEAMLYDNEAETYFYQDRDNYNPVRQRYSLGKERNNTPINGVKRIERKSGDWSFPDLRSSINTNFSSPNSISHSTSPDDSKAGYDFGSHYRDLFDRHRRSCDLSGSNLDSEEYFEEGSCGSASGSFNSTSAPLRIRSPSHFHSEEHPVRRPSIEEYVGVGTEATVPPIWCIDCRENIVVLGCANGRLEFWEGPSGKFKCLYDEPNSSGVTAVKLVGNRVVAARLSGFLDFLALESYSRGKPIDWGFSAYRRTHVRSGSAGSLDWDAMVSRGEEEDIRCVRLYSTRAHQQPITVLQTEGGRVLTGSQDHTLKVYRLEDHLPLYTLHGHCGPITCLFIDCISPMTAGSGSQDGLLCVWDLLTGACMYSIQAHDGAVLALTYSASYVISLGADDRLCVWERFQGHLLNTIQMAQSYCSSIAMLTHSLLVTSKQGSLVVWDVRAGDPVRLVRLGHADSCVFVKQLLLLRDSVVCDYGNQLRIVRFPLATDKTE